MKKKKCQLKKKLIFEFFNYYFNLYYIAFFKKHFEKCLYDNCYKELEEQLVMIVISDATVTCFKFYTAPVSARLTHPFTPWSHFFPFKPLSIFIIAVLGVLSANPKMLLLSRSVSMGAVLSSVHNTLLFLCTLLSQACFLQKTWCLPPASVLHQSVSVCGNF